MGFVSYRVIIIFNYTTLSTIFFFVSKLRIDVMQKKTFILQFNCYTKSESQNKVLLSLPVIREEVFNDTEITQCRYA